MQGHITTEAEKSEACFKTVNKRIICNEVALEQKAAHIGLEIKKVGLEAHEQAMKLATDSAEMAGSIQTIERAVNNLEKARRKE